MASASPAPRQPMPLGPGATGSRTSPGQYVSQDYLDDELVHIACELGGIAVEMMVDTGAQSSVISKTLAERLNLMGRLDRSRQGVATGVGSARILGRLRAVPVKIGHIEFQLDFTVL